MNKYGIVVNLLILVFIISSLVIGNAVDQEVKKQGPNAAERAIGFLDPFNRWAKLKSCAKLAWINYGPKSERTETPHSDTGKLMKEAVTKSYETSKGTAEHAAKVAGHAVHTTAEKVKRTVSGSETENEQEL
ncbi:hypothetical protein IFM89_010391 [Coptis chinensis]|uniref:Uncharacterized protein n=1 Tax=Coptis chinensis TaxID=261450 RepID=A0A835ISM7_9MAGN|nr:hypothetical protein IFM89_010391 [Coptis chinensis]